MAYSTHAIDNSPTLYGVAASTIENPAMLAVKFSNGKLALTAAGDPAIGIVLADQDSVAAGDALHVQIKEICDWIAGGSIAAGDMLKADAAGKCVKASAGEVVNAIALEAGSTGKPCKVMICHTAIPAAD